MKYFLKYDPTPRTAISHTQNKIIKKMQLNETLTNQYKKVSKITSQNKKVGVVQS